MNELAQQPIVQVLRWLALLPASFLAAWLGWILINLLGRFSLSFAGVDSESFMAQLYFNTAGHSAAGAAFVFAGAKTAPMRHNLVAFVLGGLAILISGFLLFPSIVTGDAWAMWGAVCVAAGAGFVVYFAHTGEIELD